MVHNKISLLTEPPTLKTTKHSTSMHWRGGKSDEGLILLRLRRWNTAENFFLLLFWKIMPNIIFSMFYRRIILSLVVLGAVVSSLDSSPCPIANHNGTVYSGTHLLKKDKSSSAPMPELFLSFTDRTRNAIITVFPIASFARLKSP